MTARPPVTAALAALVLAGVGLSGCGKTGELERPAPLFGEKAKADYDAQKRAQAARRAAEADARKDSTVSTPDDANARPLPQAPYGVQIPGQSDPFGHGPQGSMPGPGQTSDQ